MIEIKEKKLQIADKEIIIRFGEYAHQANGSVIIQCGGTIVQGIVTMGEENPEADFFPLSVDYNENLYAGGLIKSSRFIKREGKPSDEAILKARLIDRSIRPMFPKDFTREVQVVINILSSDKENPHDVLGLNAAIAALSVSDIPFDCHLGGIRLSKVGNELIVNPTYEQCNKQDYELVLAGNEKKIVMIECAANCFPEDELLKGFEYSYNVLGQIAKIMDEIKNELGQPSVEFPKKEIPQEIYTKIKDTALKQIEEYYVKFAAKQIKRKDYHEIVTLPILALFTEEEIEKYSKKMILEALEKIYAESVRENILKKKRRVDGRGVEEIREIEIKINPIPQVHGSSMFMRGETQVLNILTLGAPGNEQLMESIEGETKKRYIHHYNAPPYSVGETGRMGSPGRREIGHGGLAEKALRPVIPAQDKFPYVIRLVSEVMGQNGSSSMASTCASTVTLMAGGIPIKEPITGISIGLMTGKSDDDFVTITDIRGIEDFYGDMDFKIAGTVNSITAIQLDTKIKGLTFQIIKQAVKQANKARKELLNKILEVIPTAKNDISEYAPRIDTVQIPVEMIGKIVGPSGKVIRQLCADYSVEINIDEDGKAFISGTGKESIDAVKVIIDGIINDPKEGMVYPGKITRIMDFGAFVEIFPGKEGLIHISKLSKERVSDVHKVVSSGQKVKVRLLNVDAQGRLNFAMEDSDANQESGKSENKKFLETKKNN